MIWFGTLTSLRGLKERMWLCLCPSFSLDLLSRRSIFVVGKVLVDHSL